MTAAYGHFSSCPEDCPIMHDASDAGWLMQPFGEEQPIVDALESRYDEPEDDVAGELGYGDYGDWE